MSRLFYEDITVIIPAFNEARTLPAVISSVKEHIPGENILVVDDGSTDTTSKAAEEGEVRVVRHEINLGKGRALATGFKAALESKNMRAVITIDADGQHDPGSIPDLVEKYYSAGADIVIGDRMGSTENMPFLRRFSNLTTSAVVSALCGQKVNDSQSGFRLLSRKLISDIEISSGHFDAESEILIRAGRNGAKIVSQPIETIYTGEEDSKITPFTDTFRFLLLVLKSFFW